VVATNLAAVADPAFLRRIGYRVHMDKPDEQRYAEIFHRYAAGVGMQFEPQLVQQLLQFVVKIHLKRAWPPPYPASFSYN